MVTLTIKELNNMVSLHFNIASKSLIVASEAKDYVDSLTLLLMAYFDYTTIYRTPRFARNNFYAHSYLVSPQCFNHAIRFNLYAIAISVME